MALEKTATKGIYKTKGKKGQVSYVLMYYVQAPDPLRESGFRWKPKGKRFLKYQDALDFKVKVQSEVKSGSHQESSGLTLEELAKEWLQSCRQDWKLQTFDTHSSRLNKRIIPSLGHLKAVRISPAAIRAAMADWQQKLSPKTVNQLCADLNRIFEHAIIEHDFKQNPMKKVKRLKRRAAIMPDDLIDGEIADHGRDQPEQAPGTLRAIRPDEVFSAEELKRIIEASEPGLERALILTEVFTGVRHGELRAIRWPVIDLAKRMITINRSLTHRKGGQILEEPKTRNAYRRLELPPEVISELRLWKMASAPNPNEFVFVSPLGNPNSRKSNNKMLRACCKRAGVKSLSMNNLRHTFASQHLIAGTPLLEVSKMMGHSDPAVTLKVYSHWAASEKSHSQARLANRIFSAGQKEQTGTHKQKN